MRTPKPRNLVFALAWWLLMLMSGVSAQEWPVLKEDGVHDPKSPAIKELMEPRVALSELAARAPDKFVGNQVRWVKALDLGLIAPRAQIHGDTKVRVLDLDIYLNVGGGMPVVRFPHRAHTYWLDCANCHDHLFKSVAGETDIRMLKILEGEQCGVCHGAVAFPLTECLRCHSVPREQFLDLERKLGLKRAGAKGQVAR